jgi:hypothetical protein
MTPTEPAATLAQLPDDVEITVTVRLGDWLRAREAQRGGPEIMTSAQAAKLFGYDAAYWSRLAKAGKLAGAYREHEEGHWRLPRAECEAHIRRLQRRAIGQDPASRLTLTRSVPRGPRSKAGTATPRAATRAQTP